VVAAGVALVVLGAAAWLVVLPGLVLRRCVAVAAERGVVLTVGGVHLGFGRFALLDVEATSAELPGMSAKGAEVDVAVAGLEPVSAVATRWDIVVDGNYGSIADALAAWRVAHAGVGNGVAVHLDDAHVTWTRAFGTTGRVDALGLVADVGADGASSHIVTPHVVVATPHGDLGPWRTTLDRAGDRVTTHVAFDPAAPTGARVEMVTLRDALESFDVAIPRSSFPKLGIPARALGLPAGEATQIAVDGHLRRGDTAELALDMALFALKVSSVPQPLDATLKLSATGDGALDSASAASIGPLRGAVTGTLQSFGDGARIALKWTGGPVSCAALGALEPPPSPPGATPSLGELASELGKLAEATGIAKVSGEISMHAALVVDTRDVSASQLSFTPVSTCEIALFGSP
jgi:hypothetical protein